MPSEMHSGTVERGGILPARRWLGLGQLRQSRPGRLHILVRRITEQGETAELDLGFGQMRLAWAGDRFKAEWKQGGASFPLERTQVSAFPKKARTQDPAAPFPYADKTLAIRGKDGVMLGATLSLPAGVPTPTIVILVPGSGPLTRDEEVAGHRVFAVLADHLLRQGVAVLRYDKRGVSRSTGDYANHTQADLVDDLDAVVAAVRARGQFGRLGLVGHSEGPMIAASVIGRQPTAVDFLVSLAGVGLPGLEMLLLQDGLLAKDRGASPLEVKQLLGYISRWYAIAMAEADGAARVAALKALQSSLPESDKALIAKYRMTGGTLSPHMAAQPALPVLLKADPRPDWRRVACPVLALNGSLDLQVPPQSLDGIVAALEAGGNRRVESAVLPALNHLFQTAQTGSESEYAAIEETIAPLALQRIAAFVRKQ